MILCVLFFKHTGNAQFFKRLLPYCIQNFQTTVPYSASSDESAFFILPDDVDRSFSEKNQHEYSFLSWSLQGVLTEISRNYGCQATPPGIITRSSYMYLMTTGLNSHPQ